MTTYQYTAISLNGEKVTGVVEAVDEYAAVSQIKERKPHSIKFVCMIAAPEGLKAFTEAHPDVPVFTAAVDEKLNENAYIVPGLGDAGDRIFGTL